MDNTGDDFKLMSRAYVREDESTNVVSPCVLMTACKKKESSGVAQLLKVALGSI